MVEPSECVFNNPTLWEHHETFLVVGTQDDLQPKTAFCGHPVQELTAITAVDPDTAQFLAGAAQVCEQELGAIAVLDGGGDHHCQQQAQGINQDVAFRPVDLLPGVIAACPGKGGRFYTLAVQAASRWLFVPPGTLTHPRPQRIVDALPDAVRAPLPKVSVDALPLRIFRRQHAPLDATDGNEFARKCPCPFFLFFCRVRFKVLWQVKQLGGWAVQKALGVAKFY